MRMRAQFHRDLRRRRVVHGIGKPRGHRLSFILRDHVFDEDAALVQTSEASSNRDRQPLRRIGLWLRSPAMNAICAMRLNRRRWLAVSIAAPANSPQPNAFTGPGGKGGVISHRRQPPAHDADTRHRHRPNPRRRGSGRASAWEKISTALLPPKPNELLITCRNGARCIRGPVANQCAGSGVVKPGFGGNS